MFLWPGGTSMAMGPIGSLGIPLGPSSVHVPPEGLQSGQSQEGQEGLVPGAGRLIASCCSHLDLLQLRALNQGGKLRLAQGRLQDPDVQWTLVVVRDFGGDKASVRLANVTGRGKPQVRFTSRIDTESTFGAATVGMPRVVGPDGLVDELTNFLNGQQSKMQVHVAIHHNGTATEANQGDDLSSDLARLLDQGVLCDVVLQVQGGSKAKTGGADLRAHKAVLASRSPVFQRLFMSDMAESRTSTVAVDFPASVVEHVLRYAYTGRVDFGAEAAVLSESAKHHQGAERGEGESKGGDDVTAMALLAAADYYQLAGLKRICEERLLQRVGLVPEEALHTVVLADRYGAVALKDAALDMAASHLKLLRQRPEWSEFARHHHELVAELMGVLADKLEQAQKAVLSQQQQVLDVRSGFPASLTSPLTLSPHNDIFGQISVGRGIRFP